MVVAISTHVVGCAVRGRSGYPLILRLAPRGTCRLRELATRSSRISSSTCSCRASLSRGEKPRAAAACGAPSDGMQERQPVRVLVAPQRGFVHEPAHGEVREQQAPELLAHQVRGRARAARPVPRAGASSARPARPRSPSARGRVRPSPRQAPGPGSRIVVTSRYSGSASATPCGRYSTTRTWMPLVACRRSFSLG